MMDHGATAMRELVLKMSMSVDGFVGGPSGELDWIFPSFDDTLTAWQVERVWEAGLHIMGSRAFRDMKAYWPRSKSPFAAPMNAIPKAYFSRGGTSEMPVIQAPDDRERPDPRHVSGKSDAPAEN